MAEIEREVTCVDCIHYEPCFDYGNILDPLHGGVKCDSFKAAADFVEIQHGKWVPYEQPLGVGYSIPNYKPTHYCSHCKGLGWEFYTICPHCGAKNG